MSTGNSQIVHGLLGTARAVGAFDLGDAELVDDFANVYKQIGMQQVLRSPKKTQVAEDVVTASVDCQLAGHAAVLNSNIVKVILWESNLNFALNGRDDPPALVASAIANHFKNSGCICVVLLGQSAFSG